MRERIDRSARGTDVPAGIERGEIADGAGSRERGRMRRRLREVRRLREAVLLELGALVMEAHRRDRGDSPVIKRKAADAAALDDEARALAAALGSGDRLDAVVATGIAGACPTCGALTATSARFCATCGTALDGRPPAARVGAASGDRDTPGADPSATRSARAGDAHASDHEAAHAGDDPPTTELHAGNGDGATREEAELGATKGGDA